jgi:uncharacterized membrane protein YczE
VWLVLRSTRQPPPPPPPAASPWRSSPARIARLVVGLVVFGVGDALIVRSALGNSPWTVFAEGLSVQTPMSIGVASMATGLGLFLIWIPLRVRPGLGTVLNVVLIGVAIDVTLLLLGPVEGLLPRVVLLVVGVAVIGLGSGLYLGTRHGPGPRDGLMTGLHRATGLPVAVIRGSIEVVALGVGWLLGGTLGLGTLAFAVLIGPSVQAGIAVDRRLWGPGGVPASPGRDMPLVTDPAPCPAP